MNRWLLLSLMTPFLFSTDYEATAQGGCIEIKSILVDACGSPEGENEMVLFNVGPAPLNVSVMTIDWPNNNWQGLCQDNTTDSIVTAINNIIQGCGSVTEPLGGVLPANAKVLILTSTNINTTYNSFANLNEDLIVLFQCSGNTSGHFANFNVMPGLRTLSITFNGPGGCTDSVTYDRTELVNQFGQTGGFTFENDGAFVDFTTAGVASYLNYGCQVLSSGLSVSAGPDIGICPGAPLTANLTGTAVNMTGTPQWSGGTGTFNPNNTLTTVYTPGAGETGLVYLTLSGSGACNTVEVDTVVVNIVSSMPSVSISSTIDGIFYSSVTDPQYFYNWYPDGSTTYIPGAFLPTYSPLTNGCYYLVISTIGGCSSQSNTLCITNVGVSENIFGAHVMVVGSPGNEPWIRLEPVANSGSAIISLCDISGRVIRSTKVELNSAIIDFHPDWSDVTAGIYMVRTQVEGVSGSSVNKVLLTR